MGDCLKYLQSEWNRKEARGNKDFKKVASWVKKLGQELHYELCISESCIKIKINLIFTLWGATKSFMKAFKAVIKSFETPQRNLELII